MHQGLLGHFHNVVSLSICVDVLLFVDENYYHNHPIHNKHLVKSLNVATEMSINHLG